MITKPSVKWVIPNCAYVSNDFYFWISAFSLFIYKNACDVHGRARRRQQHDVRWLITKNMSAKTLPKKIIEQTVVGQKIFGCLFMAYILISISLLHSIFLHSNIFLRIFCHVFHVAVAVVVVCLKLRSVGIYFVAINN